MANWQDRVGKLLHRQLGYVFKPVDTSNHGGAVRVDYLGMTKTGRFIGVEVKETPNKQHWTFKGVNLTVFQQQALDRINAGGGLAYVAVGAGDYIYWYPWEEIGLMNGLVVYFRDARCWMRWTGDKGWATQEFNEL